jgi:rubrerythrin
VSLHPTDCRCFACRAYRSGHLSVGNYFQALKTSRAVKAAQHREAVREIGKENVAELMRKRGVDDPEDLD